jgi:hypothetical protein
MEQSPACVLVLHYHTELPPTALDLRPYGHTFTLPKDSGSCVSVTEHAGVPSSTFTRSDLISPPRRIVAMVDCGSHLRYILK